VLQRPYQSKPYNPRLRYRAESDTVLLCATTRLIICVGRSTALILSVTCSRTKFEEGFDGTSYLYTTLSLCLNSGKEILHLYPSYGAELAVPSRHRHFHFISIADLVHTARPFRRYFRGRLQLADDFEGHLTFQRIIAYFAYGQRES
jgi:hypothetical protein